MGELRSIKLKCPVLKKSKAKEFTRWWPLFKAYAQQVGFADMLTETKPSSLPDEELEVTEVKDPNDPSKNLVDAKKYKTGEKEAVNRNATAIASFYNAFQDLAIYRC